MTRDRVTQTATGVVTARVDDRIPPWPNFFAEMRCGRCGQKLPALSRADEIHVERLGGRVARGDFMMTASWGWQWDGAVWRPTASHKARRQRAREAAASGDWDLTELARRRLQDGSFHRPTNRPAKDRGVATPLVGRGQRLQGDGSAIKEDLGVVTLADGVWLHADVAFGIILPTRVECPRCGVENHVQAGSTTRPAVR